jgi:hypothetical protein
MYLYLEHAYMTLEAKISRDHSLDLIKMRLYVTY